MKKVLGGVTGSGDSADGKTCWLRCNTDKDPQEAGKVENCDRSTVEKACGTTDLSKAACSCY